HNRAAARFEATVELPSATAHLSRFGASIDRLAMKVRIATDPPPGKGEEPSAPPPVIAAAEMGASGGAKLAPVVVNVEAIDAASGDERLKLGKATAVIDLGAETWRVRDVSGSLTLGPDVSGLPERAQL